MSSPLNARNSHGVAFNTADAVQTVAATIDASFANSIWQVIVKVLAAVTADRSKGAGYLLVGVFKNNAGTLTQIGSTTVLSSIESDAGLDAALAVSGTDIQVKVTGLAVTNISWLVDAEVRNMSNFLVGTNGPGGIIAQEA